MCLVTVVRREQPALFTVSHTANSVSSVHGTACSQKDPFIVLTASTQSSLHPVVSSGLSFLI